MNAKAFWLLLSTVSPPEGSPPAASAASEPKTVRAAFDLAESNGLFYGMAARWISQGNALPREAEASWRDIQEKQIAFRRTVEDLNRAANASRREYCIIKDYRTVENVPRDVDVLVRETDQPEFLARLRSEGFEFAYRDEAEMSLMKPGCLRVDVYGGIHYLRRDFLDPEYLFSMRRDLTTHGVTHPGLAPEAAFLLNSAHGLFGHAELTLLDFLDFRYLRAGIPDLAAMKRVAEARGWGRVLDRWDEHLRGLESRIFEEHLPARFPARNGRRFVLAFADELDGAPLSSQDRRALSLSLLWDQLVFVSEAAGVAKALRRSSIASFATNTAGHRLRLLRGDRKRTLVAEEARGGP